ncbi:hypothetical protein ACXYTJ_07450 [Gilvimarinus sp. F26214L]|uniref:hypothetical protein n=1 Tax=Gilvimarinus sp. DZF01 TaxID=3461371 RepID=UPI004045EA2F
MTVGIIELNDAGVRVAGGDRGTEFTESPGMAVINRKGLLLGDAAMRQSRLQPLQTNSLFWHRLSAEPLPIQSNQHRHHADLAFSHLLALHQDIPECQEVVFALPGSFSRTQMSLLLGIAGQCPFKAVGLIDSAVAASALHATAGRVLHVDLQLHQCVFTLLQRDGDLRRQQVEVLPNAGLLSLRERWAKVVADQFIDQSRFDPLHSAETEQALYDQLPTWMRHYGKSGEQFLEVGGKNIKLARETFIRAVEPLYRQIAERAGDLHGSGTQVLLSDRLDALPGLTDIFRQTLNSPAEALPGTAVFAGIEENQELIRGEPGQLSFVQALPARAKASAPAPAENSAPERHATHLLLGDRAYPVDEEPLYLDLRRQVVSSHGDIQAQFSLRRQGEGIALLPLNGSTITVNGATDREWLARDNAVLGCGDSLEIEGARHPLLLIEVLEGHGSA